MRSLALIVLLACEAQEPPRDSTPDNKPEDKTGKKDEPPPDEAAKGCDPFEPRPYAPDLFIGPDGIEQKLDDLIASANHSLDVLIYEIDTQSIIDALIAAQGRGVAVRMVIDRNHSDTAKAKLTDAGIDWRPSSSMFSYAHAKTILIDASRSVIMSANMNHYSMQSERNYGIVSSDAGDAEDLGKIFEADWSGTQDALDLSCTRLVVSPLNSRVRLQQLIDTSSHTLDLSVMYLSDTALYAGVVARKNAGVAVRVILADPRWVTGNQDTASRLQSAGIAVKYMTALQLHAKLILSDDRAFVGSENMSLTSLEKNREVGAVVSNGEQVQAVRTQFETDWTLGTSP